MALRSPDADRNMLFGILALQMDFITRDALVAAMHAWVLDKARPLGAILAEQGRLAEDEHALLEGLVRKHLQKHDNDAQKSLAAVAAHPMARRDLAAIADPDLQASLAHTGDTPSHDDPERTSAHAGPTAGRFEVLLAHARGGLGEVFVARDTEVDRQVALKEIQPQHADHPDNRARFLLEAKVTGQLEHPGIVPVYGAGAYPDGRPFYAMRFVQGDSLKDAIAAFHRADKAGQSAPARSLALRGLLGRFVDVCQAVAYAHSRGVLHRDLKPGNVMLGKYGETLVVDWGLAKVLGRADAEATEGVVVSSGDSGLTQAGKALGTPAYMSPEQARGELDRLGPRSDVYSLGATLYTLLTGQPPFAEADVGAVLARAQKGDFPPPRQINARAPRALEAVCLRAMAPRPEGRYGSADELAGEVERWLADQPVSAYREPWTKRLARWARRRPALVTGSVALVVTALTAVAIGAVLVGQEQRKTLGEQQARLEQQRQAREAQVAGLLDVAPQAVPALLEGLAPYRDEVRPLLAEAAGRPAPPGATPEALALWRQHRARAALALLPDDPGQAQPLAARLLEDGLAPDEMLLVRDALRPHGAGLKADLWKRAEAGTGDGPFRALVALAAFDPSSARWQKAGEGAVGKMLQANPLHLGRWVEALRPVRDRLLPRLTAVFRGEVEGLAEYRKQAATVLADYLADRPEALTDQLMDADEGQFPILFEAARKHRERAVAVLTKEARRPAPEKATEAQREALAQRQANAGLALLKLGHDEPAWPLLRHSPYPEARSRLVALMGPGGVEARAVVARLEAEKDVSARRALILALGEYSEEQLPAAMREPLMRKLLAWYRDDPDSGVHGAIDWLLRHGREGPEKRKLDWGQRKALEAIDADLAARARREPAARAAGQVGVAAGGWLAAAAAALARVPGSAPPGGWYVNGQGMTFAVIDGREPFLMGSPSGEAGRQESEKQHWRLVGRRYALQTKPVTVAQWARFQHAVPQVPRFSIKRYGPGADYPVVAVSWYDAAAYCRWLSEQEGVPEHEMAYPPVRDILVAQASGKSLRLQAGHRRRTGYRLPSEAEWELACRSGTATSRYYGYSLDLLTRYAWSLTNSNERSWSAGQKRPNDLGLFDLHGNIWEWIHDPIDYYPAGTAARPVTDEATFQVITDHNNRRLRGASFGDRASTIRSAHRFGNRPTIRSVTNGLRVCRTVP